MRKFNSLLAHRLEKNASSAKATALAELSADGLLTGFSGVFGVSEISAEEKTLLEDLLRKYAPEENFSISSDLTSLITITSEVKAITNQAAILHGERIKKAQTILKGYKEGAFTAWLLNTYGNRQTPYNFLQYYEFYRLMPKDLHSQIESMPRQAVYTLASRSASFDDKKNIVENYKGETKAELISLIRERFPLNTSDQRQTDLADKVIRGLSSVHSMLMKNDQRLQGKHKEKIIKIIDAINSLIESC